MSLEALPAVLTVLRRLVISAFEPGDPRPWPDLIVHPLTNIDAACILSAATSHCRGRG